MADYAAVASIDFNGDFRDDVVALTESNSANVFMQQADGTLSLPIIYASLSVNRTNNILVKGDFNNDGLQDVAFHTKGSGSTFGGIGLLLSRTDQTPTFHQGYPALSDSAAQGMGDWASLDVDGDGNTDIVVLRGTADYNVYPECFYGCPNIDIFRGDGKGNFSKAGRIFLGLNATRELTTEDIDQDGLVDLIAVSQTSSTSLSGATVSVFRRLEGGGFSTASPLHLLRDYSPISFADLNGDGLKDSISGGEVHLRSADGTFGPALGLSMGTGYPNTAFVTDIDGNGASDIINHQFQGFDTIPFLAAYLQQDGVIQAPILIRDAPMTYGFKVSNHKRAYTSGDVNGDGCPDLVVAGGYDGVVLLHGRNCTPRTPRATGGNLAPLIRP
jgi:hypothetical protein